MKLKLNILGILLTACIVCSCNNQGESEGADKRTSDDSIRQPPAIGEELIGGPIESVDIPDKESAQLNVQDGVAVGGADAVAYFVQSQYVSGQPNISYEWKGATFLFSSEEHREAFIREPDKYVPQYGGYCAYAMAKGQMVEIDPEAFSIVDEKLYLNLSIGVRATWESNIESFIDQADNFWFDLSN